MFEFKKNKKLNKNDKKREEIREILRKRIYETNILNENIKEVYLFTSIMNGPITCYDLYKTKEDLDAALICNKELEKYFDANEVEYEKLLRTYCSNENNEKIIYSCRKINDLYKFLSDNNYIIKEESICYNYFWYNHLEKALS